MTKKTRPAEELSARQLEDAVAAARMRGAGRFSLADVLALLPGRKDAALENRVLRMLDVDETLFRGTDDVFCGRAEFFTGKTFLITPDVFEIRQGVLIPGHRTAAFVSPEVFPSEVELADAETGAAFGMRDFSARLDMLYNYYLLLGSEQFLDYLAADDPANEVFSDGTSGDRPAVIPVYDLADFYRKHDFQPGDALVATVTDWCEGRITLRRLAAAGRRDGRAWSEVLADSLEKVISLYEHYFDIPEQLAYGFFFGGDRLFGAPEAMRSCDEFIRETDRIELRYLDDRTVLAACGDAGEGDEDDDECGCGEHHGHHHPGELPEEVRVSRGETEDFARMLRELGVFLTPVEVDSYILDSCSFSAPDYDEFFRRCFGGRDLAFADDAQEAVFHNMVEDRWETFTANYDRESDRGKAELRGQILEILDEKIAFLDGVSDPEKLPSSEMRRLAEISIWLDELLRLLNSPKHELAENEADDMAEKIAGLGETQTALIEKLQQ